MSDLSPVEIITQEPPATEVLCFQCSGLGKLRLTFGDPPTWGRCGKCAGSGKLYRTADGFTRIDRERAYQIEQEREAQKKEEQADAIKSAPPEHRARRLHLTSPCDFCDELALMIHDNQKLCHAHAMEKVKALP